VDEQRWPWLVTASLMLAAAAVAGWSVYLHWLPCRGSMLNGNAFRGYAAGDGFSDGCLRQMDTGVPIHYPQELAGQAPLSSELAVVAIALLGLAWLILMFGLRLRPRTRAVAALPGVATLAMATMAAAAITDAGRNPEHYLSSWLWLTVDASAVVALGAIWGWEHVSGRGFLRLVITLWGTTAMGAIHGGAEYATMIMLSAANWDTPPGTGYITVVVVTISAALTMIMTIVAPRPVPSTDRVGRPAQPAGTAAPA
jgi:hypothetical protein